MRQLIFIFTSVALAVGKNEDSLLRGKHILVLPVDVCFFYQKMSHSLLLCFASNFYNEMLSVSSNRLKKRQLKDNVTL